MKKDITNSKLLGGWTLKLESAEKLPQDLASAFYDLFSKFGATYTPVFYVGSQLVNGTNHKLIVERNRIISGGNTVKDFAVVTINIPAGSVDGKGATKVSEKDSTNFILRDEIEKGFKIAAGKLVGATHKPILELGSIGEDYFFVCESNVIYPGAEPYLTSVVIRNQNDDWNIIEIERL